MTRRRQENAYTKINNMVRVLPSNVRHIPRADVAPSPILLLPAVEAAAEAEDVEVVEGVGSCRSTTSNALGRASRDCTDRDGATRRGGACPARGWRRDMDDAVVSG